MPLALAVAAAHHDLRDKELIIQATPSGNYVAGGDTVNLTVVSNPKFIGDAQFGFPGKIDDYEVLSAPDGYTANLVPGATLATWLLQVYSAANTPLAAAAYPAGVLAGVFLLRFRGPKGRL